MKLIKKLFVCALTFLGLQISCSFYASAAVLNGMPYMFSQPNSTEQYQGFLYGDEYFSYICDENGIILTENEDGYFVYAEVENNRIVPTSKIYGAPMLLSDESDFSYLTKENLPDSVVSSARERSSLNSMNKSSETSSVSLNYVNNDFSDMEINNLVIFIKFNNKNFSQHSKSFYDGLFNTNSDSMKNYYDEASHGKLGVNSYVNSDGNAICKASDSNVISYYTAPKTGTWSNREEREEELVRRAVNGAIAQIPSNLDLDKNKDGYIDMLTIVMAGRLHWGEDAIRWPHASFYDGTELKINGARVGDYNIQIESVLTGASSDDGSSTFQEGSDILIHESLHILGLPDLYYGNFRTSNGANSDVPMKTWDIMSSGEGVHMSAYLKQKYCNWIDIPEITKDGTYTLKPAVASDKCAYMIRSPKKDNEYFIIEFRKKSGNFEKNIPSSSLVVYRILNDYSWCGNVDATVSNGKEDEIRVIGSLKSGAYLPTFSDGSQSGIGIQDVFISDDEISFNVTLPTDKKLFYFSDNRVAEAVCTQLGKPESDITAADLAVMESLTIPSTGYGDLPCNLSGIENLVGLKCLKANGNDIDDIGMLSELINLEELELNNNCISDISALSSLTKLKMLKLRGNLIEDYSPTAEYYADLTSKDFSLGDDDVVAFVPNSDGEETGTAYIACSDLVGDSLYYSVEKYSLPNGKLIERERGSCYPRAFTSIESSIKAEDGYYIKLRMFENSMFRKLSSETVIKKAEFNFN